MNIYQIAEEAGVSIATVSRVLNGGSVRELTRKRVLAVMEKNNYTPSSYARGLSNVRMAVIGIIVPDMADLFHARMVSLLDRELQKKGYEYILFDSRYSMEKARQGFYWMMSKKVRGLIFCGSMFDQVETVLTQYRRIGVPMLKILGGSEDPRFSQILSDGIDAMMDLAEQLKKSGHTDWLFLTGNVDTYSGRQKKEWVLKAADSFGIRVDMRQCDLDFEAAKQVVTDAYHSGSRFDAVVTADDVFAVGALKAAHELHLSVPEDLAVVGYNNMLLSESSIPRITSVDCNSEELCRRGVRLLLESVENGAEPRTQRVRCALIQKETTK